MSETSPNYAWQIEEPMSYAHQPTDVWVALKSGSWNITNGGVRPENSVTRSIIRGLLEAALEEARAWDSVSRLMSEPAVGHD